MLVNECISAVSLDYNYSKSKLNSLIVKHILTAMIEFLSIKLKAFQDFMWDGPMDSVKFSLALIVYTRSS